MCVCFKFKQGDELMEESDSEKRTTEMWGNYRHCEHLIRFQKFHFQFMRKNMSVRHKWKETIVKLLCYASKYHVMVIHVCFIYFKVFFMSHESRFLMVLFLIYDIVWISQMWACYKELLQKAFESLCITW